jgi:acetylornithine deacetylase/succinyl-diaminopimelate desuccinylase-like protein
VVSESIRERVAAQIPNTRIDLERLVRIPSIAFEGFPPEPVLEAAEATREVLAAAGFADARVQEVAAGRPPAVIGSIPAPDGAPTVLMYAHYDVQPAGDEAAWTSPPFEPLERNGRLYGRGAADDKSGVVAHAAVVRAFDGRPPVGVRIVVEGEEETGGSALEEFVPAHPDVFAADAILVGDMGNVRLGEPTLTTALRGLAAVVVEVRTLEGQVHSGQFGGAAPDALIALVRMLATLHDDAGNVTITGVPGGDWTGADISDEEFRRLAGMRNGVDLIGTGSVGSRLWSRPSANVIGLDAPEIHGSRNVLMDRARAKVSLRLPPEVAPPDAQAALAAHLQAAAPWHVECTVTPAETGPGVRVSSDGPVYAAMQIAMREAFDREPVEMGSGGSIPLVRTLAETYPGAEIVMLGAEEPLANIHAPNESVDLGELERVIVAEALLLAALAPAE